MPNPAPNQDESIEHQLGKGAATKLYIGNFHKTLPHNDYGEVVDNINTKINAYKEFKDICLAVARGEPTDFEGVARGDPGSAKFVSPMSGASSETHGPDPQALEMPPAPGILSTSTAAEMLELYWMALLRDLPLADFSNDTLVAQAITEIRAAYQQALNEDQAAGAINLHTDLPSEGGSGEVLDIRAETLFRCGLKGEEFGPLISQFFLRPIPYGVQTIDPRQVPYIRNKDFLITHTDWLRAQNTGQDQHGRDYGKCNYYADQLPPKNARYYPASLKRRYISTLRDLARFVNRDALHQAYFNAALFLDAIGASVDAGNPYEGYTRQGKFATLGGPDLLALVSEVASRALKVVWRQKWLVHRRARPEAYGGLLQMEKVGYAAPGSAAVKRDYGLPDLIKTSSVAQLIFSKNNTYFLPMAFSAGSPSHPAYGAGHATVAGACVTVLKAWFKEDESLGDLIAEAMADASSKEPVEAGRLRGLLQPGPFESNEVGKEGETDAIFGEPGDYSGDLSVGGELNKLASNVAMGRSIGGVHWRTDNTRSLRLGEQVGIEILRKRTLEYAESGASFTFTDFNRRLVLIKHGKVTRS
ncbi:vanadium-dependent haloperoxidase [Candidatus Accumulibacter sp. ACC003]|jgi:hypothetical protein|uniref:vanadium-dependent haloperoxidase n=1 Tax=Candidatus Accumulibacter sp. ACC003 TaxID=2823334 RepID=UPI0025B94DC3|nr:vanadium-dependent haloperoxidase [Candidatus Accumulibacter sp. ACC003]